MKDQPETLVVKSRKVSHVSFDPLDRQTVAVRNQAILSELFWRTIKQRYYRSRCRKNGSLLTSGRREAERW
jgi:hypothetical protein